MYLIYPILGQSMKNALEETVLLWHWGERVLIMSILRFYSMKSALTVSDFSTV